MRWWLGAFLAVLRRPGLWRTAFEAYRKMLPNAWHSTAPYLPIPAREFVDFRMHTFFGDERPVPGELVSYLDWLKAWPGSARH